MYHATGRTIEQVWGNAIRPTKKVLRKKSTEPVWVKVDLVSMSDIVDNTQFQDILRGSRSGFFRYGIAFDKDFETVLLEAELNGTGILDYENDVMGLELLNYYLRKTGKEGIDELPSEYMLFLCRGGLCDENKEVNKLNADGLEYGRWEIDARASESSLQELSAGFYPESVQLLP